MAQMGWIPDRLLSGTRGKVADLPDLTIAMRYHVWEKGGPDVRQRIVSLWGNNL